MKKILFYLLFMIVLCNVLFSANEPVTNKIKIAILSFSSIGDDNLDTETLTETFQTELVNINNKDFSLVERTQLAKIIEEQKLQMTGITEEDAVKIGSLAGASRIMMATISMWEGRYIVNIKAIDTSTAEIIYADKLESSDKRGLMDLMPVMADRMVRKSRGEIVAAYKTSDNEYMKPSVQSDDTIQTRDLRNSNTDRSSTGKWKPSSSMATEFGFYRLDIKSTNNFFSANDSLINGGKMNFKFSGEGGFQFILGFDYNFGNIAKDTSLTMFSFTPGFLLNFINTQYIMFGGGIGYSWGWGDAEYTAKKDDSKYKYTFKQESFNYNLEAGVHITKYMILKLEWANKNARNFNYQEDSKEFSSGGFTVKTDNDKTLKAPESIYYLNEGLSGSLWAIKLDILFD